MANEEKSVTWIIAVVFVVVALLGWGFLAGSYAGAHAPKMSEMSTEEQRAEMDDPDHRSVSGSPRKARRAFVGNAIEQLPNLPAVISWNFQNRIWLPILILVLEAGVLVGGYAMKRVEKSLSQPTRYGRR